MKKIFEATEKVYEEAMQWLAECLKELGCSKESRYKLTVAFDEMFMNVASYAYPQAEEAPYGRPLSVNLETQGGNILLTLEDRGKPFDPFAREDPDVHVPLEERRIGGLGIFMTKKLMDSVSYEYRDGKNIVCLTIRKE
ncbi:MAG TPA: ATP-binding protein [Lachnospiraceae bacterium]|nr:ATP-binding protein [Lachnospiraceae bacterium]